MELKLELKLKLVTTSSGGWVGGGWTNTKLMLFSTQVVNLVGVGVELGNDFNQPRQMHWKDSIFSWKGE